MYTKPNMLFCVYQLVLVSQYVCYEVLSFACLTVNKGSWVQGGGSYAVTLLVSPLVSLTIAKFNGVHCSVVAHFSALYICYFRISCPYIIARRQST